MPVAGHAAPTPVEALINDLQLAAATSDAEKSAGPTVKLFVAPEIRTNASPVGTQRGDQLIITIALIGASMMAVVAFIGWLRNRTSW
ncbi:hypothetical protein GR927_23120 [Mycolicibacterium sp. 3033]|nr:hypothetical protein [Mycolicibacterium aurantiacum]